MKNKNHGNKYLINPCAIGMTGKKNMKTRQDAKDYVSAESISLYRIAKATSLSWATVRNYLQKDKPYSSETQDKILNFLNAIKL